MTLLRELRHGARSLGGRPLLTLAAVASLGLGIGATAAVFSAVDVFMLRPLDYPDADRVVAVWTSDQQTGWVRNRTAIPDWLDWRATAETVELAAYAATGGNVVGGDRPVRLQGQRVSAEFFDVLGWRPALGRGFRVEEEAAGASVVVLGHGTWRDRFDGDPGIVGRVVRLDGTPYEVVGVMPERFEFSATHDDFWIPMGITGSEGRGERSIEVVGRLAAGATVAAAARELTAIQERLAASHPATTEGTSVFIERLQDAWFGVGFREGSLISSVGVLLVLLIACANVANLLLARGSERRRELALRTALGATPRRLVRQLLVESLLLAFVGGAVGVGLAALGIRGIHTLFPPFLPPAVRDVALSGRVLVFTLVVTLGVGILTGLLPALRSSRGEVRADLQGGGRGETGMGGRLRSALVATEFALAAVLLVSTLLVISGFAGLRTRPLGYALADRLVVRLTLPEASYPDDRGVVDFQALLLDRLGVIPGVRTAAGADHLPMRGAGSWSYRLPEDAPEPGRGPVVAGRVVTGGYFETLGIPLIAGRVMGPADGPGSPAVVVVNRRMAERHWSTGGAVGQRLVLDGREHEVVGVVEDTRDWGPDSDPAAMAYLAATQHPSRTLSFVLHTSTPPGQTADAVRSAVRSLDPEQPVYDVTTLATIGEQWVSGNMAMVKMLSVMGMIALLLSVLGAYGVMAYSVARRTREMGVRMALGADASRVRRHVLRHGLRLTVLGLGIGLAVAAATSRFLSFFLYGVSPWDLTAFASVTAVLLLTGVAASWIPAVRATRVDPLSALRAE